MQRANRYVPCTMAKTAAMTVFKEHPNLLAQYRQGAPVALETVYRRYVHDVKSHLGWQARRFGIGLLAREDFVDELCQDVFLKAFSRNARESFDGNRAYRPYLKAIAKNTVIDFIRATHRQGDANESLAHLSVAPCHFDEASRQTLTTVRGYIADLPAPLTQLYHQRFILDHSQEATARNLELSRSQVRNLEQQLRSGLKRRLNGCGVYEI